MSVRSPGAAKAKHDAMPCNSSLSSTMRCGKHELMNLAAVDKLVSFKTRAKNYDFNGLQIGYVIAK
jgi:hypothetical protein